MNLEIHEAAGIFRKLRKIIAVRFGLDEDIITKDTNMMADLELDFMDILDLTMGLVEEFGV